MPWHVREEIRVLRVIVEAHPPAVTLSSLNAAEERLRNALANETCTEPSSALRAALAWVLTELGSAERRCLPASASVRQHLGEALVLFHRARRDSSQPHVSATLGVDVDGTGAHARTES